MPSDLGSVDAERLPVQMKGESPQFWKDKLRYSVPRAVGEAAWEGYAADGHGGQSCERLHQRGGFSLGELGYYLARAVDEGRVEVRIIDRSHS